MQRSWIPWLTKRGLALHRMPGPEREVPEAEYEAACGVFEAIGRSVGYVSVEAAGFEEGPVPLAAWQKAVAAKGFPRTPDLEMSSVYIPWVTSLVALRVVITHDLISCSHDAAFRVPSPDPLLELARSMHRIEEVGYGYIVELSSRKSPDFYAAGVLTEGYDWDSEEAEQVGRWMRYRALISDGTEKLAARHLRDVYPLSLLATDTCEMAVGAASLRAWIAAEPHRGELTPFSGSLSCWSVEPRHVPRVRSELAEHGVLVALNPRF